MSDIEWRDRAACRDEDPDLFFPVGTGPAAQRQTAAATTICKTKCKVRDECATTAHRTHTSHGVAGGYLLPNQRTSLRRYVDKLEGKAEVELFETTCASCGCEIEARIKLIVCGSCRANARHQAVDATPAREHVDFLRAQGWMLKDIYTTADVSKPTLTRLASGKITTVSGDIAAKILAVTPGMCPGCGEEKPIMSASPKGGLRGHCSKKCREASAVNA